MTHFRNSIAALAAGFFLLFSTQPSMATHDEAVYYTDWDPLDVTMIIHCCPGNVFWEPVMHAAREAGKLFNVHVDFQNADGDPLKNSQLIQAAIANNVDGIVPMISVEDALTEAIQEARDAGIVVVASNIDDPKGAKGTARQAYVGQNFVTAGYFIGQRMVKEHGLKEGDHVLTPAGVPEYIVAVERYAGVKKALDEAGVTSELLACTTVNEECMNIQAEYLLGHPETTAIIGLGNTPTSVASLAAEEAGVDLPIGGFDVSPDIMKQINDGTITATMDQLPFWQGYLPVMFIAYNVRFGLAPVESDTGMGMVDGDNAQRATDFAGTYR